mmetsp:Transcript_31597/g.76339  ORF Transcript_31597/g.76339 Transcript_31597/m.76339 type:complete len:98 (-) Transcript_31597:58-351(-)
MGINGQNSILWKSSEVPFDNIIYLLEQIHQRRVRNHHTPRSHPTISLDVSLLGHNFLGTKSTYMRPEIAFASPFLQIPAKRPVKKQERIIVKKQDAQ